MAATPMTVLEAQRTEAPKRTLPRRGARGGKRVGPTLSIPRTLSLRLTQTDVSRTCSAQTRCCLKKKWMIRVVLLTTKQARSTASCTNVVNLEHQSTCSVFGG